MKKRKLLMQFWLIAGYGSSGIALAQWGRSIQFQFIETDMNTKVETPGPHFFHDTTVYQVLSYLDRDPRFPSSRPASPILLGVKLNPTLKREWMPDVRILSKYYRSFSITDSSEATLIAVGITKENIKDYRYRVVEDDSIEVVKWSAIPSLGQDYGAKRPYGFIGNFKAPNKQLLVEVINVNNYNLREGVIFDWHKVRKPVVTQLAISTPEPSKTHTYPTDPISGINLYFEDHPAVTYTIDIIRTISNVSDTTMIAYNFGDNSFPVVSKFFNQPGKYKLVIQRVSARVMGGWHDNEILSIPFEVKPPPLSQKKVSILQLIPYTVATLCGVAFLFFIYRRQSRAKLQRVAQEKQLVGLKLRSIRAQLNPHFMFNALTSIQNLINKNNITGANQYLSKFAGLTRQVLDSSDDEVLSLEDELTILDNYLQIEQLRFSFDYQLKVDEKLNRANTEIPAMLLQPFVENAIKHGIAGMNDAGQITITAFADTADLVFTVNDNGGGFSTDAKAEGYGIKLSRERVALLGQIYKDQTITLDINTGQQGTTVTVRLSKWL